MVDRQPERMRVRMYQVGFGDCFLISLFYDKKLADERLERHVLVDFGSTRRPVSRLQLNAVADSIAASTNGKLDAVVVSHRHKDHLSGFGSKDNAATIATLRPDLVMRSWTENPKAKRNAGKRDADLLATLARGQDEAQYLWAQADKAGRGLRSDLIQLAVAELANADAVTALNKLAGETGEYLSAGNESRLGDLVPGLGVSVLGPPRPRQWPAVARQAADSKEYWLSAHRQAGRTFRRLGGELNAAPGPMRWIVERLRADEQRVLMSLVRWLDDALNNTSLILLFTIGEHRLLFGGDAQIENWGWALDQAGRDQYLAEQLAAVDLYKVGHHGSRNGTPKSLFARWVAAGDRPLVSLMSTKAGVHGHGERAVPREVLENALAKRGQLVSTDAIRGDYLDVESTLPDGTYAVSSGTV